MPCKKAHVIIASILLVGAVIATSCGTTATTTTTQTTAATTPVTITITLPASPTATETTTTPSTTKPPSTTIIIVDGFAVWWHEFKKPFTADTSNYSSFYRGAWGARLDELRSYLLNAAKLREDGVDSIMVEVEIVLDPESHEPISPGEDIFIFYLQALKREGFRIILIPNPMHPNLDQGLGYDWENNGDPDVYYHPSNELIRQFDGEVVKWARIAEAYGVEAFLPTLEPYKLAGDYEVASQWLQEILPKIKEVYHGQVWATDIMYDTEQGLSIPCPYDYSGYDFLISGPPAGRKDVSSWKEMMEGFIQQGLDYASEYDLKGFGLYEYGGYTGGIWYEDPQMGIFDQILSQEEAATIAEVLVQLASGKIKASFPRMSIGWQEIDTPSYEIVTEWYKSMGENISPIEGGDWTYEGLIEIEEKLGGEEYSMIFKL